MQWVAPGSPNLNATQLRGNYPRKPGPTWTAPHCCRNVSPANGTAVELLTRQEDSCEENRPLHIWIDCRMEASGLFPKKKRRDLMHGDFCGAQRRCKGATPRSDSRCVLGHRPIRGSGLWISQLIGKSASPSAPSIARRLSCCSRQELSEPPRLYLYPGQAARPRHPKVSVS